MTTWEWVQDTERYFELRRDGVAIGALMIRPPFLPSLVRWYGVNANGHPAFALAADGADSSDPTTITALFKPSVEHWHDFDGFAFPNLHVGNLNVQLGPLPNPLPLLPGESAGGDVVTSGEGQ